MSPTFVRWSVLPLGLLLFALRLADRFWLVPLTWRMEDAGDRFLVLAGALAVELAIPIGVLTLLAVRSVRRARFELRDDRFTVAPTPVHAVTWAMLCMSTSAGLVLTERVPNGDSMRLMTSDFGWQSSLIGVGIFWTLAVVILLVQRPLLYLDPEGLTLRQLLRTTKVTWDQLEPGWPRPPIGRRDRFVYVYIKAPPVAGRNPTVDLPIKWLHIDPTLLADTIRHYIEHPEDRPAIGTAEELTRRNTGTPVPSSTGSTASG